MKATMRAAAVAVVGLVLAAPAWGAVTVTLHYTQPTRAEVGAGTAERPQLRATGRPDAAYCHSGRGCIIVVATGQLDAKGRLLGEGARTTAVGLHWTQSYGRWRGAGRSWALPWYSGVHCGRMGVYVSEVLNEDGIWGRSTKIGDVDVPCGYRSPTEPEPEPPSPPPEPETPTPPSPPEPETPTPPSPPEPEPETPEPDHTHPVERCDHIAIVPAMPRALTGDEGSPDHWLRIANPGAASITFTVTGRDEGGTKAGTYRRELPAYRSVRVKMRDIEAAFDVSKPEGWWTLTVTGTGPLYVAPTMRQSDERRFVHVERPAACPSGPVTRTGT